MHGTTMVFLVGMPILLGFTNYVVPLQIGARDMAFPRLNALSFWLFLFGALILHFSFLMNAVPDMGWFAYAPLNARPVHDHPGVDYWIVGLLVTAVGSIATGRQRGGDGRQAAGAGDDGVPPADLHLDGASRRRRSLLYALPPLAAAQVMLLFDRHLGTHFFNAADGGRPAALAAPVLVLRPPGGLHPDPAGLRDDLGDRAGLRRASRSSATRSWSGPASSSPSTRCWSGRTTCSRPAWGSSRRRSSARRAW